MQLNDNVWDKYCMESGINCTGIIEEAELPINIQHLKQVVTDSISMPNDSLSYRWWMRRAVFHTLLENDSISQADSLLNYFMHDYIAPPLVQASAPYQHCLSVRFHHLFIAVPSRIAQVCVLAFCAG